MISLCVLLASPLSGTETWVTALVPPPPQKAVPTPKPKAGRPPRQAAAPMAALPFPTFTSGDSGAAELTTGRFPAAGTAVPPERIDRTFVRLGDARPLPLTGARPEGSQTRLEATYAGVGLATVGAQLRLQAVETPAPEFEAFLAEAGASAAIEERKARKETKRAARYVVTESTRTHVGVQPGPRMPKGPDLVAAADQPLGLPLELVLSTPPLAITRGGPIRGTLLRDGKPVPSVPVRVLPAEGEAPAPLVTDAEGGFLLSPAAEGRLLLAAAVVRRTDKNDRKRGEEWKKADWEVLKTSLQLSVLPAPQPPPAATPRPSPTPKRRAR